MVGKIAKTLLVFLLLSTPFFAESPFTAELSVLENNGKQYAQLTIHGPQDGHVDSESLELSLPDGFSSTLTTEMALSDSNVSSTNEPFFIYFIWAINPPAPPAEISATFQGCTDNMCYMPQTVQATIGETPRALPEAVATAMPDGFRISEPLTGYHNANDFLNWLFDSIEGKTRQRNLLERVFAQGGWLLACLLTVILGIALNLTPCVLPMIPITLGVLGAKSAGNGRFHGAMLGGIYGGAMALTYGLAGCAVVLLGGRLGAINSNPYFQFGLAVVFVLLGLAMFDFFLLDFSRFRDRIMPGHAGAFAAAAFLGMTAALMAGACIAPVLIWVLLLSARLYADGAATALWLPLLLGIGLGLPWPFLGAGIGALPRPGAWMNHLKKAMGVLILLFACYTAWNGFRLMRPVSTEHSDLWRSDYAAAMAEARSAGKPMLLDFWGVSCKACQLMEATTFRNAEVREAMKDVVCVSVQGDQGDGTQLAEQYGIVGFPTYILLVP